MKSHEKSWLINGDLMVIINGDLMGFNELNMNRILMSWYECWYECYLPVKLDLK